MDLSQAIPVLVELAKQDARILLIFLLGLGLWHYERQAREKDKQYREWLEKQVEFLQNERRREEKRRVDCELVEEERFSDSDHHRDGGRGRVRDDGEDE
ncbi:hypothetical protein [Desmospora activa]|uniref:Uncharacterized protein n=1 Tax=Desmospora activa DSM 45169 TaxID=1121389 RepID=A0A2T4Z934_9BACL|nr:hypothetical protein [Desmospora activa]PTM58390.1 hypothetical protein C8J48_0972 [Desmospora activa DSM 45169]